MKSPLEKFGRKYLSPSSINGFRNDPVGQCKKMFQGFKDESNLNLERGKVSEKVLQMLIQNKITEDQINKITEQEFIANTVFQNCTEEDRQKELQKMIGCGRLVTDQKLAKNTVKPVHRLIFSSKDSIRSLLKGIEPHLKLKALQARAVLNFIDENDSLRKNELYQLVTYNNWKEHKFKAESLLNEWGIDADTIGTYAVGL